MIFFLLLNAFLNFVGLLLPSKPKEGGMDFQNKHPLTKTEALCVRYMYA